jgi:hypothetical protein
VTQEKNHAVENGRAWLASIVAITTALKLAEETDEPQTVEDYDEPQDADSIREIIQQQPLGIEVRSGWYQEYMILLSTGGPALRITGDLDGSEPESARLEWQDWGTPWTPMSIGDGTPDGFEKADAALMAYASQFYFGE